MFIVLWWTYRWRREHLLGSFPCPRCYQPLLSRVIQRSYLFVIFMFPLLPGSSESSVICKNCGITWPEPPPNNPAADPIRFVAIALVGAGTFLGISLAGVVAFPFVCLGTWMALLALLIVYRMMPFGPPDVGAGGNQGAGSALSHALPTSLQPRPDLVDGGAVRCSICGHFGPTMPGPSGRRRCGQCSTPF